MSLRSHRTAALAACLAGSALILPLSGAVAQEADAKSYSLFTVIGGQATSVDGERDSKFEEFRDVPDGAVLEALRFGWVPSESPWSFTLDARDVDQEDEGYALSLRNAGGLRLQAGWERTPHFFSRGSRLLHGGTPGNLTLSQNVRSVLEADPTRVREFLAVAPEVDLRLRRDVGTAALDYDLTDAWSFHGGFRHEDRDGRRRTSVGTYIRRQSVEPGTGAGSFDRERFEPRGLEMPEPVDYRTTDYDLSTALHGRMGFLDLGWQGSAFSNHVDTLFWDNPFEAFPSVASAADRGRFARAALDLAPDNTFQRLHASGGLNLPGRTRLNATAAFGTMEQDAPFLPFTLNEALFFPGPDGRLGTSDDVPGTSLALLPAASLDGQVDTTRADVRLTSRPFDPLTLRAAFRRYEYDDRSPELVFPGYAAFGDSAYRVGIGLRLDGVERLFREPGDYDRTLWSVGGSYRFGRPVLVDLEYSSTDWEYEKRQVDGTTEDAVQATLRLEPVEWLSARLSFLDASRDYEGLYDVGLEGSRVRAFDVWTRERTRYGVDLELLPGERWTLSLSYYDWRDEYPGVVPAPTPLPASNPFPSFRYGLNDAQQDSLSLTGTFSVERWTVTGTLGHDTSLWDGLMVSKTTLTNDTVQFDPANQWRRVEDDTVDWASLGLEARLVPDRVTLLADVSYSDYDGRQKTTNPNVPNINSGVAYDFPAFSSDLLSGDLALRWVVTRNAELEARYLYEPYRLDDFMWDAVQPYMLGIIDETAGAPNQIRDTDVRRFLLLDSRYSDYTANVFSLALRLRY